MKRIKRTMDSIKREKKEKNILFISFAAGLMFAIVEVIFSIHSHSQSVLMDGVYDASELIFIALILFLTPLFYKPISEEHPYGFFQIESIFIIIKVFMMLSVSVSVSVEIIESALAGGNDVNKMQISFFQLLLGLVSMVIYAVMKRLNRSLSSPTVDAELLGWKTDIAYSIGMSAAFFGATFLGKTPLAFLAPYFDQIVAVAVMLIMLPQSIKMLCGAIKDVFLFPPDEETVETIKEICNRILNSSRYDPVFYDITKTGRHLWVSVYFTTSGETVNVDAFRQMTASINEEVSRAFENCTCELILKP